ncbi:MAG: type IV pilus assembly protein PilM [Candidatus Lindowbacteria bacterium]|nr:type IV pilus assembly protein PilM [Candidatus Lindowbacteria bacterium]
MISSGKKIGVDAGSSLIKVVELGKGGGGAELARWSVVPWRAAPNSPPDAARQMQAKAIDAAIKKSDCKCRDIVVGVPGNNAFIRNIKLPPIPSSKIDQIVRYEIQQTIPFPIENIALDYQVLEPDESSEVEVIMVAMKGEVAESFIHDVEQAKVKVGIVDSIPLALYNCYRYNGYSNKEDCTAVIELGATSSNILIELKGELRYCRSVGIGGNDITNALAREFNIPFEQAERIKIQHGLIFPETQQGFSDDQVRVSKVIAGVLDRLLGEIKLTVGYFRSLTGATAISKAVLAGGGALLRNIKPFLADRLGVQVEVLNPFKKVGLPKNLMDARKVAPALATAVGLALRSSQECCQLKISLVPPKVKAVQSRRTKLSYNAGSVLAVLGIIGLILWRTVPEVVNKNAIIAAFDVEIGKYQQHEPQLNNFRTQKNLLLSEYNLYAKYPAKAVDPMTPLIILSDSLDENNSWLKSVQVRENGVTVRGVIKSDTKVEELKQLSKLRVKLEKYCSEVKVNEQSGTSEGLSFTLDLSGLVDVRRYLELREKENVTAQNQPAEARKEGA